METLSAILRRNDVETMLRNARLVRHWPEADEKAEQASLLVRMAMYRHGLAQLSSEEHDLILDILRPCCPEVFGSSAAVPNRERELPIVEE